MSREGRARWGFNERFIIGAQDNPMMMRWRLLQTPLFGIYLHFIYREDLDRAPHDHPWSFWSLVLRGSYIEDYRPDVRVVNKLMDGREHKCLSWHHMPLGAAHQIVWVEDRTVTLCLVGRKQRNWGFYDTDEQANAIFVDYRDALRLRPTEGYAGKRATVSS